MWILAQRLSWPAGLPIVQVDLKHRGGGFLLGFFLGFNLYLSTYIQSFRHALGVPLFKALFIQSSFREN